MSKLNSKTSVKRVRDFFENIFDFFVSGDGQIIDYINWAVKIDNYEAGYFYLDDITCNDPPVIIHSTEKLTWNRKEAVATSNFLILVDCYPLDKKGMAAFKRKVAKYSGKIISDYDADVILIGWRNDAICMSKDELGHKISCDGKECAEEFAKEVQKAGLFVEGIWDREWVGDNPVDLS
jgi:hypothetical protein